MRGELPRQGRWTGEGQRVGPPHGRVTTQFGAWRLVLGRPPTQGVGGHGTRLDTQDQHALLTGARLSQGGNG